jgi:glutathione S-transferase
MAAAMAPGPDQQAAILWSFRRCPYAIRARLALAAAGIAVEVREVNLTARPPEFQELGPPGTVPVLQPREGPALRQSLEVMVWALERQDPGDWLGRGSGRGQGNGALVEAKAGAAERWQRIMALVAENDGPFKHHLDRFKYASRYVGADPAVHRQEALAILRHWNNLLEASSGASSAAEGGAEGAVGWLLGGRSCLADWALLPFVRQFRLADPEGFAAADDIGALRAWLARFERGPELAQVMAPPLAPRQPWRSPRWLYHLALAEEWQQALAEGVYRRSTRGMSLEQVGFLHASYAHQIEATFARFYADAGPVRLLSIDPARLAQAGLLVREEPAPDSGERFPHLYGGPRPCGAVVSAEPYRP